MTLKKSLIPFLALASIAPLFSGCQATKETGKVVGDGILTAGEAVVDFFDPTSTYIPKDRKAYEDAEARKARALSTHGALDHSF